MGCVLGPALLAACSSGATPSTATPMGAVEDAVRSYSSAYLRGDGQKAHDMLSVRCQKILSLGELNAAATGAAALYGRAQLISVIPTVDGDRATVTYRFSQPAGPYRAPVRRENPRDHGTQNGEFPAHHSAATVGGRHAGRASG